MYTYAVVCICILYAIRRIRILYPCYVLLGGMLLQNITSFQLYFLSVLYCCITLLHLSIYEGALLTSQSLQVVRILLG